MNKFIQLEETLQKKISSIDEKYLSQLTETEKAKIDGMKKGVEETIIFLELRAPITQEKVFAFFSSSISKAIYSLMRNEEKYNVQKSKRLECKIAYNESLIETLQLLRDSFSKELET